DARCVVVRAEMALAEVIVMGSDDDDLAGIVAFDDRDQVRRVADLLLAGREPQAAKARRDVRTRRAIAVAARRAAVEIRRGEVRDVVAQRGRVERFAVGASLRGCGVNRRTSGEHDDQRTHRAYLRTTPACGLATV